MQFAAEALGGAGLHLRGLAVGGAGAGGLALRRRGAALPALGEGFLNLPPQLEEHASLISRGRLTGLELALEKNAAFLEGRLQTVRRKGV